MIVILSGLCEYGNNQLLVVFDGTVDVSETIGVATVEGFLPEDGCSLFGNAAFRFGFDVFLNLKFDSFRDVFDFCILRLLQPRAFRIPGFLSANDLFPCLLYTSPSPRDS